MSIFVRGKPLYFAYLKRKTVLFVGDVQTLGYSRVKLFFRLFLAPWERSQNTKRLFFSYGASFSRSCSSNKPKNRTFWALELHRQQRKSQHCCFAAYLPNYCEKTTALHIVVHFQVRFATFSNTHKARKIGSFRRSALPL